MSGMFMFPGMFYNHIKDSKLKMPEDFENYNPEEYPHFHVFMLTHLGQPIDIAALEDNANIIADIPENTIKSVTLNDLMEKGVVFGTGDLVWNENLFGHRAKGKQEQPVGKNLLTGFIIMEVELW